MDYDVTAYPEGFDRVRDTELVFLPEDKEVRSQFMDMLLLWLVQW